MLSFEDAKDKALEEINKNYKIQGDQIIIRDEYTLTNDYGWIFSYQSKLALEGSFKHRLVGNLPLFVSKENGSLYYIPHGTTIEDIIKNL